MNVLLKQKDYKTNSEIKWCSGCGDYAILFSVQNLFTRLQISREKTVFVSGIGCSSRLPYYMNAYGIHSIHGRAPAIATGLKVARPDLSVWLITGDGDALSIGGNHTLHMLRKNIDLNVLLFNNRIFGLTKGQYSPTSPILLKTKSSPFGSIDMPVNPIAFALGANATFIARGVDKEVQHLSVILKRANEHVGTSFVEIYQNCTIFNDGTFNSLTNKLTKCSKQLLLKNNQPLLYDSKTKGISFDLKLMKPIVIDLKKEPEKINDIIVHNENDESGFLVNMYARLNKSFPSVLGVYRVVEKPELSTVINKKLRFKKYREENLKKLLYQGNYWIVF